MAREAGQIDKRGREIPLVFQKDVNKVLPGTSHNCVTKMEAFIGKTGGIGPSPSLSGKIQKG
jgi:hypothetical protein